MQKPLPPISSFPEPGELDGAPMITCGKEQFQFFEIEMVVFTGLKYGRDGFLLGKALSQVINDLLGLPADLVHGGTPPFRVIRVPDQADYLPMQRRKLAKIQLGSHRLGKTLVPLLLIKQESLIIRLITLPLIG